MQSVQLAKSSYLHPLGQQLGIFRGLLLVLLSALSLQGNATALVLQHTRSYQSLDPGSFSSGLLACRKTIIPHEETVLNRKITHLLDVKPCTANVFIQGWSSYPDLYQSSHIKGCGHVKIWLRRCSTEDKFNELLEKLFFFPTWADVSTRP